jgi:hypothetical protein
MWSPLLSAGKPFQLVDFQQHVLQTRVIIKLKARSTPVHWLAIRRMYYSGLSIGSHLIKLFVKSLILD